MTAVAHRQIGGWTLIEATIVIVIVAALAAVAAPRLFGLTGGVPTKVAANQLIMDLQYARTRAMNRSEPLQLMVDADGYRLVTGDGTPLPFADQRGSDSGDSLRRSFEGITFSTSNDEVTFDPTTGDVSGDHTITVDDGDQLRTLNVHAPAGLAEVQQ